MFFLKTKIQCLKKKKKSSLTNFKNKKYSREPLVNNDLATTSFGKAEPRKNDATGFVFQALGMRYVVQMCEIIHNLHS